LKLKTSIDDEGAAANIGMKRTDRSARKDPGSSGCVPIEPGSGYSKKLLLKGE